MGVSTAGAAGGAGDTRAAGSVRDAGTAAATEAAAATAVAAATSDAAAGRDAKRRKVGLVRGTGAAGATDAATAVSVAGTEAAGAGGTTDSGDALSPMAVEDTPAADVGEVGDGMQAASMGPSAGHTAETLQAAFDVFRAAFDVPAFPFEPSWWTCAPAAGAAASEDEGEATGEDAMEVAAEQVPYVAEGGGEDGGTSAVRGAVPMDGERWVDAGVGGAQPHEFAAGFTTWYLERMEAGTPMLLEDGDRAVTRQSAGQTGYDGAVQLGAVGMEAERSTDETGGADRDAAGTTTTGSTDMTTTSAGVAGMEVEGQAAAATGTAAAREQARRYRTGRQAQMTSNQRKRMKKLKAREQGK